jgi:hypothetical protein
MARVIPFTFALLCLFAVVGAQNQEEGAAARAQREQLQAEQEQEWAKARKPSCLSI